MKTSIIVAAYNVEQFLADTIQGIQQQTAPDWELIVVDDGSWDQTAAIAHAFARRDSRIRVLHQARGGSDAARNAGFAATDVQTDSLVFLDSDDIWESNALETLRAALATHPDGVGVYGQAYYMDAEGRPVGDIKSALGPAASEETPFDRIGLTCLVPPGAFLLRRWACEAAGLFDASVMGCEDWDLWLRMSLYGSFFSVPEIVIGYRQHASNMTKRTRLVEAGHERLRQKIQSYQTARAALFLQAAKVSG